MFGNVTSSWANPQQNQQQQPASAFGQPSAFGATNTSNAFGSTGAFGQPQQQQQQPQANPMFGNLSTPANNTGTTSAFGGFGSTANTSTGAFGAKPAAAPFGPFGGGTTNTGTGAFGTGTGAFGQPANTGTAGTGLFGQPAVATTSSATPFGGTNLFGQNKTSTFGTAVGTATPPVITTGSQNPPYSVHHEKDGNTTSQYQAISCMPTYLGYSFEEIRVQDYAQGRKTASTFGQSAAFGTTAPTAQPATSLFGAAQPAQQNTSAFGGVAAGGPANTGFGAFGNTNTNSAQTSGTGLFGSGGTFGAPAQQQPAQTTAFGGFGAQPQQQQQSTGLFGVNNAFGGAAAKPAFGGFGTGTATTTNTFGGTGAFGLAPQPAAQPTTSLFGNTQPAATNNAFGGGAFGTAAKPLFGPNTMTTVPAATGFNAFSTTQQPAQQQPQQGTGLFGANTGLFGQQQPQQPTQQSTGIGLFGNANTQQAGTGIFGSGGGLFGNNQQQQQAGAFGLNKPATPAGGLFGNAFGQPQNTTQATGGLFGNSATQPANQQGGFSGGLFSKPAAPTLGISTSMGQSGLFGSTLGSSSNNLMGQSNAPAQGTLTASISQPVGSNLPIFSMLPPGPRLVDLDQSQPKKKPPFFVDVPTRSPIPRVQQNFTPANSKLRGFGASTTGQTTTTGNPFAGSVSFLQGKPNALLSDSRAGSVGPDSILGRSGSPALGSGSRQSVKKVILDKKIEASQLFIKSGSPVPGGKVVFSAALSIAARESEAAAAAAPKGGKGSGGGQLHLESPTPTSRATQKSPNRFTAQSSKNVEQAGGTSDPSTLEEGDYWLKPDLASLKKLGYDELSAFKGLTVGRVGYGEIGFLEPVDLTGLAKLGALLGEVIHFEDKECSVYPDSEDADKPPPGSGLNVKAKLTLERCWAVDKATREPIKDANHHSVVKHLKRLKNMKDTHFENFDMATGKWTFIVDHF